MFNLSPNTLRALVYAGLFSNPLRVIAGVWGDNPKSVSSGLLGMAIWGACYFLHKQRGTW